ncbi:MAG: hypothetical protein LBH60_01620 [Prevotellaceae bacterium]|jgi:tetratricopeptide (TPR) repeat protein|nr:hypothetical protein [Prevotellaceae bacterium]
MSYNFQIQKILVKTDTLGSSFLKLKLIRRAINIADINNDVEWGFDLRKRIIEEEMNTSSCMEGLPAFMWLLKIHKQYPEICDESTFMPEYKWMIRTARQNANVSMQQFEDLVEDYKTRLQRNGFSMHSYYTEKAQMAFQRRKLDEAKEYLELRKSEERDELSQCVACELHDLVEYELLSENLDAAISISEKLFSGKECCDCIPFKTVCLVLKALDEQGCEDSADKLYEIVDSEMEKERDPCISNIGYVGNLIHYLTKRDKYKAWDMFEKYLVWSINCEDYHNFLFSSGSLSLFKGSGTCFLDAGPKIPWYKPSGIYELPELYDYYKKQAATLAARFDARNGSTSFTDELSSMD